MDDLASRLGEDADWLQRKLYGRVPADLGEMWAWMLELQLEPLGLPDALVSQSRGW